VARGNDPGGEPSCGAPAHDAYRSDQMRHSQFPRERFVASLDASASGNQAAADEEIVAPIRRKRESNCRER
jgi:hypothetical protein